MPGRSPLFQPTKKHAIGLSPHLPVLSTQETFRMEQYADQYNPNVQSTLSQGYPQDQSSSMIQPVHKKRHHLTTDLPRAELTSPSPAVSSRSTAVYDRTVAEVAKFIDTELALLGSAEDGATQPGVQRLTIFKEAFRMLLPLLPAAVSRSFQRIMREYDKFLVDAERSTAAATQRQDRERLALHFERHFMEEGMIKEMQIRAREEELVRREGDMTAKLTQLENQLKSIREENRALRQQQNEDTEKYLTMAQSVVESRLTAQKGELAVHEMREFQAKKELMEESRRVLLNDANAMYKLLVKNNIPFKSSFGYEYDLSS